MNILAFDTSSSDIISVALQIDEKVACYEVDSPSGHSQMLMYMADKLMEGFQVKPECLNLVACAKGPGSFTGLRIGYSLAKGLALALGIPLAAVPTLDYIAHPLSAAQGIVIPVLDAKKSCFFSCLYRGGKRLSDYADATCRQIADEIEKHQTHKDEQVVLSGSGAGLLYPRLLEFFNEGNIIIDQNAKRGRGKELIEIAKRTILERGSLDSGPLYLRKSDAELSAKGE
ncbi:MAG: tRNA (adenosine(37)-N6)-threonylcarbamoyltransferase complex dimerization subunit type 1 TsaB [Treponema sp.]|nr:tRNA (adenosine(37)-N6)-threonylcarbamoyltransferase complex dimerization subunit type 1 TsaB [Treponema sp.]